MSLLNNSGPPPDRLVEPKLGCLPVRKTLIVYSVVSAVLCSLALIGFITMFYGVSEFNQDAQNQKLVEQSRQKMMQQISQQVGQELGDEWSKQYGTDGQQMGQEWGKALGKAWEQQLGKGVGQESQQVDVKKVVLGAVGFALAFHVCATIGSFYYHDTLLRICQYICMALMVCSVLTALPLLKVEDTNVFIGGALHVTVSGGMILVEYICIKRLREFIARRKATRDQTMA